MPPNNYFKVSPKNQFKVLFIIEFTMYIPTKLISEQK